MILEIQNKGNRIELDGIIRGINNKFYVEIFVPDDIELEPLISNIKGDYNSMGKVTLVNNRRTSIKGSKSKLNENIHVYEAGYLISGDVDEKDILLSSMVVYFKELDYFFVEDEYKIDIKKMKTELTITQKYNKEVLLENERLTIEYNKTAGISNDMVGHTLFLTPAKINIKYKEQINMIKIFEEINKITRVLGFVLDKKMNLIETILFDTTGKSHVLITRFQEDYNNVKVNESFIVDLNSKQLLKDVLKKYYSDTRIASTINMFYEYIYNELDYIFEFTSLVNTLELVISDKKYKDDVKNYAINYNEKLKENNLKMNKIIDEISEENKNVIYEFYDFKKTVLRDKLEYIFYVKFKLNKSKKSNNYISAIINTRNYYVHGTKRKNVLKPVDIIETKLLLKMILYILIMELSTKTNGGHIFEYKAAIPTFYDTAVKYFN